MAKVKCGVCANELNSFCTIKKVGIKPNKARNCDAYVYDEKKLKKKQDIHIEHVGYSDIQKAKKRAKEERKEIRRLLKEKPLEGTARDLGLVVPDDKKLIITPEDFDKIPKKEKDLVNRIANPGAKYPLTGDLSRFVSSGVKKPKGE